MKQGRIVDDAEIKESLVHKRPWKRWVDENMIDLDNLPAPDKLSGSRIMTTCWFGSRRLGIRTKT